MYIVPHQSNSKLQASVQEGITLLQNAAEAIRKFNKAMDKLFYFTTSILESDGDNAKLKDLETLITEIIKEANSVSAETGKFIEWTKREQKTVNDQELVEISFIISKINTYVNDTNISLNRASAIKSWKSMQNNEKYESLLKQLFGKESKHSTLKQKGVSITKQEGVGAIEQYKNAASEFIETLKNNWPFNKLPETLGILNKLAKTVDSLGDPQAMDLAYQIQRELAGLK